MAELKTATSTTVVLLLGGAVLACCAFDDKAAVDTITPRLLAAPEHAGTIRNSSGSGQETQLGGLSAYIATPQNYTPNATMPAVLIFTDIYGWQLNNTRLYADNLATQGFLVIVPDFFKNDSIPVGTSLTMEYFQEWLAKHSGQPIVDAYTGVVQDINKT
eukprot:jgi/Chrzof1/11031/Cz05g21030.t1